MPIYIYMKSLKIKPIIENIQTDKLRWFGHVMRRDENTTAKKVLHLKVKGKRPRGRPRNLKEVFLILLISGWVVAASLKAEKTNVGMAGFGAGNTSVCGFGSDGAAALLSACSFVRCDSHQFAFSCLEVLF